MTQATMNKRNNTVELSRTEMENVSGGVMTIWFVIGTIMTLASTLKKK